jgi:hypothetical protein
MPIEPAKPEEETSDEELVAKAELRAKVIGFLTKHKGTMYQRDLVAEKLGVNVWSVGTMLKTLADEGLIERQLEGSRKYYFIDGEQTAPQPDAPTARMKRKTVRARTAEDVPPDVELVIAGTLTVVVGRNPATGRIRVTLFDEGSSNGNRQG